MSLVSATISGLLTNPSSGRSTTRYALEPATTATLVTTTGRALDGRIAVTVAADGTADVTLWQLPQADVDPSDAKWRLIAQHAGGEVESFEFELTGDITWDAVFAS